MKGVIFQNTIPSPKLKDALLKADCSGVGNELAIGLRVEQEADMLSQGRREPLRLHSVLDVRQLGPAVLAQVWRLKILALVLCFATSSSTKE